jgi:hypothetical protein
MRTTRDPREGGHRHMADNDPVPEADALEQALPSTDADPELLDVRPRAVPAAVASRPIPVDAPEHDVLEQRLPAGDEDDDDEFR